MRIAAEKILRTQLQQALDGIISPNLDSMLQHAAAGRQFGVFVQAINADGTPYVDPERAAAQKEAEETRAENQMDFARTMDALTKELQEARRAPFSLWLRKITGQPLGVFPYPFERKVAAVQALLASCARGNPRGTRMMRQVILVAMPSKIESLKLAAAEAVRPPSGMIEIEGVLRIRRSGLAQHRKLKCWNRHPLHSTTSRKREWPVEGTMRCGHRAPGSMYPCEARIYVQRVRSMFYFAMDVTLEEANTIDLKPMDIDEIIAWFGVEFPQPITW